jgi:hypothetical protein
VFKRFLELLCYEWHQKTTHHCLHTSTKCSSREEKSYTGGNGKKYVRSVYIFNRCPKSALDMMTPYEAWYEKKPNVNHFRVFGCVAYVHVVYQKRQKLDPKSESCIFFGYSEQSKAYRLCNPLTNSIVVSRDVIFYEGGVYGHKKCHDDMSKSVLDSDIIGGIDNEQPTNISVPSATNPPSSPSSNS